MKKLMLLTGILGACALSQALPLFNVSIEAGGVEQDPSGVVSYEAHGASDYLDLKNDAHFSQKTQPYIGVRITNNLPILPNLKLDYMPMKFSGYGTLNRTIVFGGTTYQANANFNLNAKMNRFDVLAYYHLPFIAAATKDMLKVRLGLNVRIVDFSETFTGNNATINNQPVGGYYTESKSLTVPVPMGHVGVTFSPIKQVSLVGDLNYVSYGSNDHYNYNAGLRLSPVGLFKSAIVPFIQVGYRYEKLKIDQSSVYADVKVKGPYALIGVEF
jgi:outer membrane protein